MFINLYDSIQELNQNGVVAIPTETVYGLAANAKADRAVAKIYDLKKRPSFNPLIVHVKNKEQADTLVHLNAWAHECMDAFWPGPLTLILPLKENVGISPLVTAGLNTLAIRCPNNSLFLNILNELDFPLAAPSANPSGYISPTSPEHVEKGFKGQVKVIDGGRCQVGLESTILDLSTEVPTLLRPGFIASEDIFRAIGVFPVESSCSTVIKAPGQLQSHYAPQVDVRLNARECAKDELLLAFGPHNISSSFVLSLSRLGDVVEAATNLFDYLHVLDEYAVQHGFKRIAVMPIPNKGLGYAINERLQRAAAPRP